MDAWTQWNHCMRQAVAASPFANHILVSGEGTLHPRIMMIGEAPGGEEEKLGRPFVGKAGKNLTTFLQAVGLSRADIYLSNVVKLRPTRLSPKTGKPINRPPSKEEIAFFLPFLQREIALVDPEWIVTLGNVPLKAVLNDDKAIIGDYHGTYTPLPDNRKLFALYHPAAVIYNRSLAETYAADLATLHALLRA